MGVWLLSVIAASPASAQPDAAQEAPTFVAGVSVVHVDAQVVEGRRVISDLAREDFEILDEGSPRPIEYFGRETEPLHLVLLLDVSGSMRKMLDRMAAASKEALSVLRSGDTVAVIAFGRTSVRKLDFSADMGDAAAAVGAARFEKDVGAGTLLNPAIAEAARYIGEHAGNKPGRRALLVFTDNDSVNYQSPDQQALEALFAADTVLNAIVPQGVRPPDRQRSSFANPDFSPADIFKLARESGGEVVEAGKSGTMLREVIERIRTRYSLHYRAPEDTRPGFRRIEVRLAPAARARLKKAEVRARTGYVVR
ncbi:MAG: VWA domain-containing protein [Bryobacterales bacterium]|nr:VWA domain-containing protein [Bryobacterales bacterium]